MDVRKPRTDKLDAVLGARVRVLRKERGLSQSALAEKLGITFQQVQKYENGSNRISAVALLRLANALNVEPMDLLGQVTPNGEDTPQSEADRLVADFLHIRSPEVRASVLRIVAGLAGR